MANRIMLNQTSYHGAGAIQELPAEVKSRGLKKALICCGPTLLRHGVIARVTDVLDAAGLSYEIFSDIKPNPTIANVTDGVAAFKAAGADYLIAIGGGSPMDTSKAIGIIINNPEFADVRSLEGVADTKKPCVPIIAIPTTAGTAAEVTINYVITDVEKYIAGMGFSNVGLGIAHSMAHTLGAVYDTPHGVACAMMLPIVMEYNADCTGEKYREIARAMGVEGVDSMTQAEYRKAAVDAVKKLSKDVGIPEKLEALKEEDLPFLAESAYADACRPGNPKDTSVADMTELFRKLM